MTPSLHLASLRKVKAHERVLLFVFGGVVTVLTGIVAERFGPIIGGLFLSFPAILPASLELTKKHDGRGAAENDARGASLGALGLASFGLVVWVASMHAPAGVVLVGATLVWLLVSSAAWWACFG